MKHLKQKDNGSFLVKSWAGALPKRRVGLIDIQKGPAGTYTNSNVRWFTATS